VKPHLASTPILLLGLTLSGCDGGSEQSAKDLKSSEVINRSLREELEQLKSNQLPSAEGLAARIGELEQEVNAVNQENQELRKEFEDYKKEFPLP
jgi:hypothetical protein